MQKVLIAIGIAVLAVAGGVLAWQLAGDDSSRRQGALTATSIETPTLPQAPTITIAPTYEVRTSSTTVTADTLGEAIATCASARVPVGGGHNMSPNIGPNLFASYPSGGSRRVRLFNPHPSVNMNLTAYAVCVSVSGYEVRTQSTVVTADTLGEVAATCPAGKLPAGGGHNMSPNIGPKLFASYPSGASWRVRLFNPHPSVDMNLTAYAVCTSVSGYEVRTQSTTVTADTLGEAIAGCPTGKKVLGGGHNMGPNIGPKLFASYPSGASWRVRLFNPHPSVNMNLIGYAVCGTID